MKKTTARFLSFLTIIVAITSNVAFATPAASSVIGKHTYFVWADHVPLEERTEEKAREILETMDRMHERNAGNEEIHTSNESQENGQSSTNSAVEDGRIVERASFHIVMPGAILVSYQNNCVAIYGGNRCKQDVVKTYYCGQTGHTDLIHVYANTQVSYCANHL